MLKLQSLFFAIWLLIPLLLPAQDIATHRTIVLRDSNLLIRFSIPTGPLQPKPRRERTYFYYQQNEIRSARAGYTGALLDGRYEVLYAGQALHTQGRFLKGQKSGRWRYWYPDGHLLREDNWKKGRRQGRFTEYDAEGHKSKSGKYRNDQLHGTVRTHQKGAAPETLHYRKGILRQKKEPPPDTSKKQSPQQ